MGGGKARKNTSGHSRQVFVPAKYARNVFRGLRCTCAATLSHKNKLQSSSKQIWSNALERTNHHDDTLPLAPVQLVEKKRKKAVTK